MGLVNRDGLFTVYENPDAYVVPTGSIKYLASGELILAFREAPRRARLSHIDPESRGVILRSHDGGLTWPTAEKTVVYDSPDPRCGLQDLSVSVLRDGTLVASFFQWRVGDERDLPPDPPPGRYLRKAPGGAGLAWIDGAWTVRSFDGGRTWEQEPHPVITPLGRATTTSDPVLELPGGELLLPGHGIRPDGTDVAFVIRSSDRGETWHDYTEVASDPSGEILFMEPSLAWVDSARKLLCMFRTRGGPYPNDLYLSVSADLGYTWTEPRRIGVWGGPPQLLALENGDILCVYGYRRPPYGVRACLSRDGGETWEVEDELVIYDQGPGVDLGYPAAVQRPDGTILVAWYVGGEPLPDALIMGRLCEVVGS